MRRRHELTDQQWEQIGPLLPGRVGDPGRTAADNRLFVDAVLFVAKTGVPWRDLPERFGRWNSVWRRFDRWCAAGVWAELAGVLGEPNLAELHLDSTTVKAQHSAAGSRLLRPSEKKRRPTGDAASAAPVAAGRPRSTRR
jgi:putative transposase